MLNLYSRFLETLLVSKIIKKNIGYSLFKIVRSHYQEFRTNNTVNESEKVANWGASCEAVRCEKEGRGGSECK